MAESRSALDVLYGEFTVWRLGAADALPEGLDDVAPCFIARTEDELSIVGPSSLDLPAGRCEPGWSCLRVAGPLDFALTGILAGISGVLADAGVPLFAVSTFDTDYVLVKTDRLPDASLALRDAGYRMTGP